MARRYYRKKNSSFETLIIGFCGFTFLSYFVLILEKSLNYLAILIPVILLGSVVLGITFLIAIHKQQARRIKALQLSDIDKMSGSDFEKYLTKLLEFHKYKHIQQLGGSGDKGADILATIGDKRFCIQAKCYNHQTHAVDRKAISDAVGAMKHYNCSHTMVITTSFFTPDAIILAKSNQTKLVDRTKITSWIVAFHNSST